jgi:site-specific recombinase XerD
LGHIKSNFKPLREAFNILRAVQLTKRTVEDYIKERREAGKADATINRETELLRRAYRLALEDGLIPSMVE